MTKKAAAGGGGDDVAMQEEGGGAADDEFSMVYNIARREVQDKSSPVVAETGACVWV